MTAKTMMDTAAGAGAMSLPWWALGLSDWAQLVAVVAGAALVLVRLGLALRECWGRCRGSRGRG